MRRATAAQLKSASARCRPLTPIVRRSAGIRDERVDGPGQLAREALGVSRLDDPVVLYQIDRDEAAGLAVDHDLGDAAHRRRDHGDLAGHRLQVDEAERLVDRRAAEDRRVGVQLDRRRPVHHLRDPHDARPPAWASATAASTSRAISGVSGIPAHSTTCDSGVELGDGPDQVEEPFCREIRPTKRT